MAGIGQKLQFKMRIMNAASFDAFTTDAHAAGFDETLVREYSPHQVVGMHSHAFDVEAVVTSGEMWLTHGGSTRHVKAGGTFELGRDTPHEERYGSEGATLWVARRNDRT